MHLAGEIGNGNGSGSGPQPAANDDQAAVWHEQQQALRVKIHAERLLHGLMPFAPNGAAPAEADLLDLSFTSHRRFAGPLVIAVKRILHRLVTPILSKQVKFNRSLFDSLHTHAVAATRVVDECAALRVAVEDALAGQILQLEGVVTKQRGEQRRELEALRRAFGDLCDSVTKSADSSTRAMVTSTATAETAALMRRQIDEMTSTMASLRDARTAEVDAIRRQIDDVTSTMVSLRDARTAELDAIRRHLNDLTGAFEGTRDRLDTLARDMQNEELDSIRHHMNALTTAFEGARARLEEFDGRARRLEEDSDRAMRYVRRMRAAAQAGSTDPALFPRALSPAPVASKDGGDFDYAGFEARFRGSPEAIAERQRDYLRYFEGDGEVLDMGCGRGEFLSSLLAKGIPASGIDTDLDAVLYCQERGLPVRQADMFEDLQSRRDQSLAGVFLAQVIEHLSTAQAIDLVGRVYEKLRIGGVFVVETLNPESYAVMARWFLLDPTHIRLVHPETLRFILESKGFRVGPCEYRQPVPESEQIPRLVLGGTPSRELDAFNGAIARVNKMLYGPLDYYLVARRV